MKYSKFLHLVSPELLRHTSTSRSMSDKLRFAMRDFRSCSEDQAGCGEMSTLLYTLQRFPAFFCLGLSWQSSVTAHDISSTVSALETTLDLERVFHGIVPAAGALALYALRCIICYYGRHWSMFALDDETQSWSLFDDTHVRSVGSWTDVTSMCTRGQMRPAVLFYERPPSVAHGAAPEQQGPHV